MNILVLGGDKRLIYAARFLNEKYTTDMYANYLAQKMPDKKYDVVVLGIPSSTDGKTIKTPLWDGEIDISAIPDFVKSGGMVTGGMVKPALMSVCRKNGIICEDYYEDECVILKNAVPSAEGALALGINSTESTVFGSRVLVTGYGRIATLLSKYLAALGADVTVAARSREKRILAQMNGCRAVDFSQLKDIVCEFSLIYNTVPFAVLDKEIVKNIPKGVLYVELASVDGIDTEAAKKQGVNVIYAPGLPAKTAPYSAGRIIADAVEGLIEKYRSII